MRKRRFSSKASFTLIELLVVISVIAIMMTMLLPALSNARETARKISETGIIKQMGMASANYGADFSGALIPYLFDNNDATLKYTHFVGYYMGFHNYFSPTPKDMSGPMIRKMFCYDDKSKNTVNAWWPSYYWHTFNRFDPPTADGAIYNSNATANSPYSLIYGKQTTLFKGTKWPQMTQIRNPSTQVLARCPVMSLPDVRSHLNWRCNACMDGHVERLKQTDL